MTSPQLAPNLSNASHIGFEILVGTRRISCGVSNEALEAAAGLALPSTSVARRRSFDRFRTLIHSAAKLKFSDSIEKMDDYVLVQSDDLRRVPLEKGVPVFGTTTR